MSVRGSRIGIFAKKRERTSAVRREERYTEAGGNFETEDQRRQYEDFKKECKRKANNMKNLNQAQLKVYFDEQESELKMQEDAINHLKKMSRQLNQVS